MTLIAETTRYNITRHAGGIEVTRLSDLGSLFFQPGDDAAQFEADLQGEPSPEEIDIVCDQYAELFEPWTAYD